MTLIYLSSRHKLQNVKIVGIDEKDNSQSKTLKIFDPQNLSKKQEFKLLLDI